MEYYRGEQLRYRYTCFRVSPSRKRRNRKPEIRHTRHATSSQYTENECSTSSHKTQRRRYRKQGRAGVRSRRTTIPRAQALAVTGQRAALITVYKSGNRMQSVDAVESCRAVEPVHTIEPVHAVELYSARGTM